MSATGDDQQDPRLGVGAQGRDTLKCREPADGGVKIAPPGADRVRDAATEPMDQGRQLLNARPRGADHADGAAANPISEAQTDPVDDRGPAFRSHDQEPTIARAALEGDLVVDRDAVTEEKHV